jgi:hypothetical protein
MDICGCGQRLKWEWDYSFMVIKMQSNKIIWGGINYGLSRKFYIHQY